MVSRAFEGAASSPGEGPPAAAGTAAASTADASTTGASTEPAALSGPAVTPNGLPAPAVVAHDDGVVDGHDHKADQPLRVEHELPGVDHGDGR